MFLLLKSLILYFRVPRNDWKWHFRHVIVTKVRPHKKNISLSSPRASLLSPASKLFFNFYSHIFRFLLKYLIFLFCASEVLIFFCSLNCEYYFLKQVESIRIPIRFVSVVQEVRK